YRFGPLTPSARSGDLIAGDGTKNGLSRSEQKTLSTTQNNRLTGKAPYKSTANLTTMSSSPLMSISLKRWARFSEAKQRGEAKGLEDAPIVDAARQLVPADRGSDCFLQIGAGLPGLDHYRSQPGQKTDLVIDR